MEWRSFGYVSNPDPSLTVTSFSDFTVTYVSVQSHRHSSNWGQNRRISCEVIFKPGRALQQDGITLSCCMVPRRVLVGYSCPASFATDACRASTSEDILDRVGITHRVFNRHPPTFRLPSRQHQRRNEGTPLVPARSHELDHHCPSGN